jgi:hypothetical protein
LENFETVHFRHFEIEEDESRKRVFVAIKVAALPAEIGNSLLAVRNDLDWIGDKGPLKGPADEEDVVLQVLDE